MGWGRKKTQPAVDKPLWNQDDYHKEFAGQLKAQIEQGVAPWQKPCPPFRSSVSRPITSHVVYNYLIYRYLLHYVLA